MHLNEGSELRREKSEVQLANAVWLFRDRRLSGRKGNPIGLKGGLSRFERSKARFEKGTSWTVLRTVGAVQVRTASTAAVQTSVHQNRKIGPVSASRVKCRRGGPRLRRPGGGGTSTSKVGQRRATMEDQSQHVTLARRYESIDGFEGEGRALHRKESTLRSYSNPNVKNIRGGHRPHIHTFARTTCCVSKPPQLAPSTRYIHGSGEKYNTPILGHTTIVFRWASRRVIYNTGPAISLSKCKTSPLIVGIVS